MEDLIKITQINDFIFCPASIYFHNLYGDRETTTYQRKEQINVKIVYINQHVIEQ